MASIHGLKHNLGKKPSGTGLFRKNKDIESTSTESRPLPSIRMIPHSRNDKFHGRDALLDALHAGLSGSNTTSCRNGCENGSTIHKHRRHVLHGLGGSGKTQVAVEYSYRHFDDYKVIIWLLADNPDKLQQSFVEAAELLGLDRSKNYPAKKYVLETLGATDDKYLLVFDNVDDFAIIKDYLPTSPNGAALITTRDSISAEGLHLDHSHVSAFSVEQGAAFMDSLVPHTSEQGPDRYRAEACQRISTIFHGYPLALSQVAGFILSGACTLHNFESLLQEVQTVEALENLSLDSSSMNVAQTRDLSLLSLASLKPNSRKILDILAYLDPDSTPMELFTAGSRASDCDTRPHLAFMADPRRFEDAINGLQRQSLIRTNDNLSTMSIHRITQQRVLTEHQTNDDLRRVTFEDALFLLTNAQPHFTNHVQHWSPELWHPSEPYIPHIKKMEIEFLQTPAIFKGSENRLAQAMYQCATYEFERTYFTTAAKSFKAAKMVIAMASQPDILLLCDCCRTESRMYNEMNKARDAKHCGLEARRLAEKAIQLGLLDHNDPRMIRILTGLGNTLSHLEEWEQAQAIQDEAWKLCQTLTDCKSDVAIAVEKNVAYLEHRRGNYKVAEKWFRSSLDKDMTLCPAWAGLGNTVHALGRHEEGLSAQITALKYYSELFGGYNYIIADCKYKVGEALLRYFDDHEKAL